MNRTMKFSVNGPTTTPLLRPAPTTCDVDDRDNTPLTNSIMNIGCPRLDESAVTSRFLKSFGDENSNTKMLRKTSQKCSNYCLLILLSISMLSRLMRYVPENQTAVELTAIKIPNLLVDVNGYLICSRSTCGPKTTMGHVTKTKRTGKGSGETALEVEREGKEERTMQAAMFIVLSPESSFGGSCLREWLAQLRQVYVLCKGEVETACKYRQRKLETRTHLQRGNVVHGWPSARSPRVTAGMSSGGRSPTSSSCPTPADPCRPIAESGIQPSNEGCNRGRIVSLAPGAIQSSGWSLTRWCDTIRMERQPPDLHLVVSQSLCTSRSPSANAAHESESLITPAINTVTAPDDDTLACHTSKTPTALADPKIPMDSQFLKQLDYMREVASNQSISYEKLYLSIIPESDTPSMDIENVDMNYKANV
ncbi:hypothetical protein EAG_01014 [Camponotus floridanus]|uniref:Uncharacterized protein n=1 Tax=Camponotus floridanus TaxID=104421 RepID=E2AK87_CAMFO|nr:hypothetical protein EAG_01014 [Camponotus floridanus]